MTFISYYTGRTLSMLKYSAGLSYRQSLKFPMQQSRGITLLCVGKGRLVQARADWCRQGQTCVGKDRLV